MKSSYSMLMQSKYYSSAFNSALFDGPLRIYFAQMNESLALKIYFLVQQRWPQEYAQAKEHAKLNHCNMMVMIYPTAEVYQKAMAAEGSWSGEAWDEDFVVGLDANINDSYLDQLVEFLGQSMKLWLTLSPGASSRP